MQPYWKHYYAGARGVVFVVDSAASDDELDVAAQELLKALSNPMLHSEPCLVLCNCQDKDGARNTQEVRSFAFVFKSYYFVIVINL